MSTSGFNFNIYRERKGKKKERKTKPLEMDANKFLNQGTKAMLVLQEKVATWLINHPS